MSPQHWAKETGSKNYNKIASNPKCLTTSSHCILYWGGNKFKKTVPLGDKDNVATMYSSPSYEKFHAFELKVMDTLVQTDNGQCIPITGNEYCSVIEDEDEVITSNNLNKNRIFQLDKTFDISKHSNVTSSLKQQNKLSNQSAEMLRIHENNAHIPFPRIREMARQGLLPKYLETCPTPACLACLYGRAIKRPWRNSDLCGNSGGNLC